MVKNEKKIKIWKIDTFLFQRVPDTALYNGLFTNELSEDKTAVVQHNGAVAWILARTFKVLCERLDPGAVPFDGLVFCDF